MRRNKVVNCIVKCFSCNVALLTVTDFSSQFRFLSEVNLAVVLFIETRKKLKNATQIQELRVNVIAKGKRSRIKDMK